MRAESRALVASNIDTQEQREEEKRIRADSAAKTFETVAKQWMKIHSSKVSPGTLANNKRYFEKDVFPLVGKIPIENLNALKAVDVINSIVERSSHVIARKVARRMNNVMTFAVNSGIVHHNPLVGIRDLIPATKVVHQPALPPHKLPELLNAIRYSTAKITTRCLIEFQLHTMVRPGEAAEAKLDEFDLEKKLRIIPAERMKTECEHIVPLTDQVVELLGVMKPVTGDRSYVFTSSKDWIAAVCFLKAAQDGGTILHLISTQGR